MKRMLTVDIKPEEQAHIDYDFAMAEMAFERLQNEMISKMEHDAWTETFLLHYASLIWRATNDPRTKDEIVARLVDVRARSVSDPRAWPIDRYRAELHQAYPELACNPPGKW